MLPREFNPYRAPDRSVNRESASVAAEHRSSGCQTQLPLFAALAHAWTMSARMGLVVVFIVVGSFVFATALFNTAVSPATVAAVTAAALLLVCPPAFIHHVVRQLQSANRHDHVDS